jgi:hypothetical protein
VAERDSRSGGTALMIVFVTVLTTTVHVINGYTPSISAKP